MDSPLEHIHFEAPSIEVIQDLLPAYEIEGFIAQGGMGAVYNARQISLDRPVAIKILPVEFGADPAFRASFEAEAKAMARLNHPNLISVYDFGEIEGMLFLVMEFVHGKSLFHSSHGKAIDPTQAAEIVIAICRGLDHAHAADILHRDVKPANILLAPDATPKIGDFGLASPMNETASSDEIVYGTPGYTAPEIIHRQQVDRRADIFSIGVILHELLTGSLPDDALTPPSRISGSPLAFDPIVSRCLQNDPQHRYTTAAELADDLEKAIKSPLQQAPAQLNLSPVASSTRPGASATLAIPQKKSPVLATTLTLIAVAVVGIIAFVASQNNEPLPEQGENLTPSKPTNTPPTQKPVAPTPTPSPPTTPAEVVHTPTTPDETDNRKSLAALKQQLANGDRTEFPRGSKKHKNSHFLLLKKPSTLKDAIRIAEAHGGHLAIAASQDDKQWLADSFAIDNSIWIGAGIAAREQWQWMDDTPWSQDDQIAAQSKQHRHATLTPKGKLASSRPDQNHAFIIQWRNDGSNPCTIEAQLKRTSASIKDKGIDKARYPVGTRTYQQSHFLMIPKVTSWDQAHQIAKGHQGQLAVPSSPAENQWLTTTYSKQTGYWLGGYLLKPSSPWQWTTKEAWHGSGWKTGEPKNNPSYNRTLMSSGSSGTKPVWISSRGTEGDTGAILIEWSQPKTTSPPSAFDTEKWLASVNRKIKDRVEPDVENYQKDREQLIDKYVRDMKRAAKKFELPGRGGNRRNNIVVNLVNEAMKTVERSGELPEEIPDRAPEAFHDIHDKAAENLEELETEYEQDIKKHLEFYTEGLTKKATELAKQGYNIASDTIKESIASIGDSNEQFLETLELP